MLSTLPLALLQSCDIDGFFHTSERSEEQFPAATVACSPWQGTSVLAAELFDFVLFEQHQHAPPPSLGCSCAFCLGTTSFPFLAERERKHSENIHSLLSLGAWLSAQFHSLVSSVSLAELSCGTPQPTDTEPDLNRGSACCKGRRERC